MSTADNASRITSYAIGHDGQPIQFRFPWSEPTSWPEKASLLSNTSPSDMNELCELIQEVSGLETRTLPGLQMAIEELESELPGFDFFTNVLSQILETASKAATILPASCAVLFRETAPNQVSFTAYQAYAIACAAFLRLIPSIASQYPDTEDGRRHRIVTKQTFGHLDWSTVYRGGRSAVGIARIKCQLAYLFHQSQDKDLVNDSRRITFYRTKLGSALSSPDWATCDAPLSSVQVTVSAKKKIEDVLGADVHLDFANKYLHIGQIIPSATQEEVLFSIRPECFIGLMFTEEMAPNEAVVITGARRFCNYTGYLQTFRFAGRVDPATDPETDKIPAILAIDAIVNLGDIQFRAEMLDRDLNKAFLGFAGVRDASSSIADGDNRDTDVPYAVISTGKWGCGAFLGDPHLKFIQQVMAAVATKTVKSLKYSTFGQPDLAASHIQILQALQSSGKSVADVYRFLVEFSRAQPAKGEADPWSMKANVQFEKALREFSLK